MLKELARNQRTHLRGPGNAETTPLTSKDLDAIYGTAFIPRPRGRGHETPELAVIRALRLPACQGPTRGPDSAASDQGDDFKAGNAVPGQKYGSSADGSSLPRSHWAPAILAGALSAPPEIGVGYPRPSGDVVTCVPQTAAPLADDPFMARDTAFPRLWGWLWGWTHRVVFPRGCAKLRWACFARKTETFRVLVLLPFHTVSQGSRVLDLPFSNVNLLWYGECAQPEQMYHRCQKTAGLTALTHSECGGGCGGEKGGEDR